MSAFIVGKVHIDALLTAALGNGSHDDALYMYFEGVSERVTYENVDRIGAALVKTNVESVRFRYPGDGYDDMPGPIDNGFAIAAAVNDEYTFQRTQDFSTGELLAAITCYEYQSCEHDGWETSYAREFCDRLRKHLCRQVPDYEETWEITERGNPPISMFEMARR